MKTYKEAIRREAEIAHSAGYMGEGTTPRYERTHMVAEIYGLSASKVKRDIEAAVDVMTYGPRLAKKVAADRKTHQEKIAAEGRLYSEESLKYGYKVAVRRLLERMRAARRK